VKKHMPETLITAGSERKDRDYNGVLANWSKKRASLDEIKQATEAAWAGEPKTQKDAESTKR
jgi:hypothetical protein